MTIAINQSAFTIQFDLDISLGADPHAQRERLRRRLLQRRQRHRSRPAARRRHQLQRLRDHHDQGQRPDPAEHDATDHIANGILITANSFKLHIDGTVSLLSVIKLNTSVDVIVGGNQTVTYGTPGTDTTSARRSVRASGSSASAAVADFFGLATLNALGWVDSKGHFGVDLSGGITIGGGGVRAQRQLRRLTRG